MDQAALYSFLSRCRYGVVSSVSGDGTPQSALVGIAVTPALEIIFDTVKTSRKYSNLIERPACSFVIGGEGERTVQYEGTAIEIDCSTREQDLAVYFAAWPDGRDRLHRQAIVHFIVKPRWIRYCDYSQRPELVEEFSFV